MTQEPNVIKKQCRELELDSVIVFTDRAELKRVVHCELKPGLNEIHIQNIPKYAVDESVRVDGKGDGIVHDVQIRHEPTQEKDDSEKKPSNPEGSDKKSWEVHLLKVKESLLVKRIDVLDKLIVKVGDSFANNSNRNDSSQDILRVTLPMNLLLGDFLGNLKTFLNSLETDYIALQTDLYSVRKELKATEEALSKASNSKKNMQESLFRCENNIRTIVITLESEKGGDVDVDVSYQVNKARWMPSYDIRYDTRETNSLKVTYYGNISQNTDEDWKSAKMILSTAQPYLGGKLPKLGILEAVIHRPPPLQQASTSSGGLFGGVPFTQNTTSLFGAAGPACQNSAQRFGFSSAPSAEPPPKPLFGVSTASVSEPHPLNTEFTIARPILIPSDGASHRVTIGIIDVEPLVARECVPSKNTNVFLIAHSINSSDLPFLKGDAHIYHNNSFVCKTSMNNVSPGDRFSTSLGVDTSLNVDYKPVKKFYEQVGYLTKGSSMMHDQMIVVKNPRNDPVLLTIREPIPRSTDERIKIKLVNPSPSSVQETQEKSEDLKSEAKLPTMGAKMIGSNLEWTVSIPGGKAEELHMLDEGAPTVIKKECRDQQLARVVVFNDRAELKRVVECELKPGLNDVYLENVTNHIIYDSVRVDGRGDGFIHDVQLQDKSVTPEDTDSPKAKELRTNIEQKEQEVYTLQDRVGILQRRIEVLDRVVGEVGSAVVSRPKTENDSFTLDNGTLDNLTSFFSFYDKSSTEIRAEHRSVQKSLEKAERELAVLRLQLEQESVDSTILHHCKTIIVTLESIEGGKVELEITYQVDCASWRPSYDIRVETGEHQSLKIVYYGIISQSTQEDWSNASLVLSTAQPSLGGHLPELGVLEAVFYRPTPPAEPHPFPVKLRRKIGSPTRGSRSGSMPFAMTESLSVMDDEELVMEEVEAPKLAQAKVALVAPDEAHALSTEFVVSKPAAIPSDGAEHKVTIGIVDVEPILVHECVPSKNTSAFLTASAVNNSDLPFLAGETSVYLNNSFVSKGTISNVSPGERFSCSLGVDTALRIEYKPVKKYHEQTGLISKSSSTVHDQLITIKNTRNDPVLLTLKEPIPRSTDEKIRIRLINPTIAPIDEANSNNKLEDLTIAAETPRQGAKMKGSILEWTLSIRAGMASELHVKWAIDHPANETVQFIERPSKKSSSF
ncbi:unnamed protein product [Cylicocyclus nassatus]|uniref:Protein F37C4.5 n=1 Tax=Cylicocyclus nassatus TaxID=53992 RepID=A0AA36H553_CYLNA|nr:unnamed protein product [Cylicocyclus nassatus]